MKLIIFYLHYILSLASVSLKVLKNLEIHVIFNFWIFLVLVLISCIMVALGGWVLYIDQKGKSLNSKLNSCFTLGLKIGWSLLLTILSKEEELEWSYDSHWPRLKFQDSSVYLIKISKKNYRVFEPEWEGFFFRLLSQLTYFKYIYTCITFAY